MDESGIPSQEFKQLLLFSISVVIVLAGTQRTLSMIQWLLQFSLESLTPFVFFFYIYFLIF